jgi:glycerol-3-phosphate dehydrogenase (NAD(P)+)
VLDLGRRHDVELPLTEQVVAVCHQGRAAKDAVTALMQRELTAEGRGIPRP